MPDPNGAPQVAPLTDAERAILLDPCACGHTLNDHGSLAGCWVCGDETPGDQWCRVECEALIAERVARIVALRTATEPAARDSAEKETSSHE